MNTPFIIYSESTPNPAVMKFVANKTLAASSKECFNIQDTHEGTLLRKLFTFPFIKEIFISGNYISIKKHAILEWSEVTNQVRIFIQEELNNKISIYKPHDEIIKKKHKKDSKLILDIENEINLNIRPNIQMDGGDIEIISCEKGVLKVFLKGACSGCPSSQITLKNGIESLLKIKFPSIIKEVVAINN
tara:strand:- start:788 stop:1354 length:567 start_codon:yes stop_codon:yes gene_type:complete